MPPLIMNGLRPRQKKHKPRPPKKLHEKRRLELKREWQPKKMENPPRLNAEAGKFALYYYIFLFNIRQGNPLKGLFGGY